jgi:hypothetical protein
MRKNLTVAIAITVSILASSAAFADKRYCTNVQSKCAIEIGGRCDPVTGKWEYGKNGAGGNTTAYNDCVFKATYKKK